MKAQAHPGQTVEIEWNFFNLRGDRPTHVLISKSEGPNWNIIYSPESELKGYEVSGIIQEIKENFAMPKSEIVSEKPEKLPTGKLDYIVHPNSNKGYILVDEQMKILIEIPENAEIGKQQEFVFEALGSCFGEQGAVSASLATELKVILTPSTEYYEKPLDETSSVRNLGQKIANLFDNEVEPVYMIGTGTTLILVIVFVVMIILASKRKKRNQKTK